MSSFERAITQDIAFWALFGVALANKDKISEFFAKQPEVADSTREPFVPVVAPGKGWSLDAEEEPTTRKPFVPVVPPTPVCPPTEIRMDLTTADTINYDPTIKPCGCPAGYRKVEVRRGHTTATRCYSGA